MASIRAMRKLGSHHAQHVGHLLVIHQYTIGLEIAGRPLTRTNCPHAEKEIL